MVWSGFPAGALIYLGCPSGFCETRLGSGPKPVLSSVLGLLLTAFLGGFGVCTPSWHWPLSAPFTQAPLASLMSVRSQAYFPFRPLRTWWEIPIAQRNWGSSAV